MAGEYILTEDEINEIRSLFISNMKKAIDVYFEEEINKLIYGINTITGKANDKDDRPTSEYKGLII